MEDHQSAFRRKRSTINQIFSIRQILSVEELVKCYYSVPVVMKGSEIVKIDRLERE